MAEGVAWVNFAGGSVELQKNVSPDLNYGRSLAAGMAASKVAWLTARTTASASEVATFEDYFPPVPKIGSYNSKRVK